MGESNHACPQKFFQVGGNVNILLIFFRLLTLQCKWTFTKLFTVSTLSDGVSRLVSRPIFASLGLLEGFRSRLGLEGYRSRDLEYCQKLVK